ncbi:transposase family protein [Streptomyces litchfieldiae]|uniref:transposase family protein n=1 Tax=Streptomyces litchfieldiae TaxID=3075543 RepID=UPI00374E01E0
MACPDCGRESARVHSRYSRTLADVAVGGRPMLGVGVLPLVRAGLGAAVFPTLALTGAPPETVALPTVPVAGHRRIAAVWPASPSGPQPRTAAVVEALRQSA